MPDVEIERLVTLLEAQTKQFDNAMKRVDKLSRDTTASVERNLQRVESSLSRVGSAFVSFSKGLAVGAITAGFYSLTDAITDTVSSLAKIGDLGDNLGTSSDFIQELQYGAAQANLSFEGMEKGLVRFAKAISDAKIGTGDFYKLLQANGEQVKASYEANLDTVADLIKNAASETDALYIANVAFGRGAAAEFAEFLRNGSAGLKSYAREAHQSFAVIESDAIKSAQEIDDKWAAMWLSLTRGGQTAVVRTIEYLGWLDQFTSSSGPIATNIGKLFDNLSTEKLTEIERLSQERLSLVQQIADKMESGEVAIARMLEAKLADVNEQLRQMGPAFERLGRGPAFPTKLSSDYSNETVHAAPGDRSGPTTQLPKQDDPDELRRRRERERALEMQKKRIDDVVAALKFEHEQLLASDLQQDINNALRRANVSATSEQGKAIAELVTQNFYLAQSEEEAIRKGEEAAKAAKAYAESWKYLAEQGIDVFSRWSLEGEKLGDMLDDLIKQLAKAALMAAFFGSGPLAGLFGTSQSGGLFGSAIEHRAGGGPTTAGKPYIVGEKGKELWVPDRNGYIVPHNRLSGGGLGGGRPEVRVFPAAGMDVMTRQGTENGRELLEIFIAENKKDMARGGYDAIFRQRYNQPNAVRRT